MAQMRPDDLIVRRPEPAAGYYRPMPKKGEHRSLTYLGKFEFKSDEAVAYNYYAAYYLGGPLNRTTEWQHDLDERYLERWTEEEAKRKAKTNGFKRRL
jgi:hypothetical protein